MKRLSQESKIAAYNDAIEYLRTEESGSDTPEDVEARKWLADKLDRECNRWYASVNRLNRKKR